MNDSIGGFILVTMLEKLNEFLAATYNAMSGSFYKTAVIIVTLYVVVMGYLALKGKVGESLMQVAILILSVPICFGIFFHLPVFKEWIMQPILSTMLGLMGIAMDTNHFSFSMIFQSVDNTFSGIFNAVDNITNQMDTWDVGLKAKVFFVSALLGLVFGALYAVFTVLILTSIFSMYVMFVLAPIFGTLAAFRPTRSYFFAWLKTNLTYALVPVFTAIVMGITIYFINAAVDDISNINIVEDGIFTKAVGGALLVGLLSIFLHLKAPEYAAAITGAQISGIGGFFGAVGGIAAAGAMGAGALGGNKLMSMGKQGMGALGANVMENGLIGMGQRAYSKMRGFIVD